jgi:hypothetical protein
MNRSLSLVLLLAAGACAVGPKYVVTDSEIALLGGKGLDGVEAARKEEAAARRELEARRGEDTAALREIRITEYAIRRDQADLEVARLRFEAVQETHDADKMLPANTRRSQAEHAVATSNAELSYRQAARSYQAARVDEAEAAVGLALARVERAKLDAVLGGEPNLLPPQAQRKAAFDVQLSQAQASLAEASARVLKAKADMEAAESEWKALAARRP